MRRALAPLAVAALLAGCAAASPDGVAVANGWTVEVLRDDLVGPTQVDADGGPVFIAQLDGGEDDAAGTVLRFSGDLTEDPSVVAAGLLTPTGVVATGRPLFVQEQRELVRYSPVLGDDGDVIDAVEEVIDEGRPFNGRSHGTLTLLGFGELLATASGAGSGPDRPAGSGELFVLRNVFELPSVPVTIAVGFKNAYGHTVGPDGDLWVTEVGDGRYDGESPRDELHRIPQAVWQAALSGDGEPYDGGWPRCTGDADPTEEFGATVEECEALPAAVTTFEPRATPTSVAVTEDGRVLVALWVEGRVVEVDPETGEVTDVLTEVGRPQHLLAMPDGTVLLTVHDRGELWRLTPPR